jgi:hypothetical protein
VKDLVIYCADIGSVCGNRFGWARVGDGSAVERGDGKSIAALVDSVAGDLSGGPVALGFECPLWLPLPERSARLGKARANEGARPWSAGAGAAVLATGMVQIPWILERLKEKVPATEAHLDWPTFRQGARGLFLWEAFVSGAAKESTNLPPDMDPDVRDATIAARRFAEEYRESRFKTGVPRVEGSEVFSTIGAALLRTGWSEDLALLERDCLVLKVGDK